MTIIETFLTQQVFPLFTELALMSAAACCIGIAILAIRKIFDGGISPFWKYALWFVMLFALVCPLRFENDITPIKNTDAIRNLDYRQAEIQLQESQADYKNLHMDNIAPEHSQYIANLDTQISDTHQKSMIYQVALPAAWLAVMLAFFGYSIFSKANLKRKISAHSLPNSPRHEEIFAECKETLGITKNIELVTQDYINSPAIVGVFSTKVLLPAYIDQLSDEKVKYILLHELAHAKRGDNVVNQLLILLQGIYCFNPLIGWLFKFLRQDMEVANDAYVLQKIGTENSNDYLRSLVDVLAHYNKIAIAPQVLGMVDGKENISRRITMIKLQEKFAQKQKQIAVVSIVVIIGLAGLFLSENNERSTAWTLTEEKIDQMENAPEFFLIDSQEVDEVVYTAYQNGDALGIFAYDGEKYYEDIDQYGAITEYQTFFTSRFSFELNHVAVVSVHPEIGLLKGSRQSGDQPVEYFEYEITSPSLTIIPDIEKGGSGGFSVSFYDKNGEDLQPIDAPAGHYDRQFDAKIFVERDENDQIIYRLCSGDFKVATVGELKLSSAGFMSADLGEIVTGIENMPIVTGEDGYSINVYYTDMRDYMAYQNFELSREIREYSNQIDSISANTNLIDQELWAPWLSGEFEFKNDVITRYKGDADIVEVPYGATGIDVGAFWDFNGSEVILPDGLEFIGAEAFTRCANLEKINIPDSVKFIGSDAFDETPWYNNLSNDFVVVGDGILLKVNNPKASLVIPEGVKTIYDNLLYSNQTIKSVKISDSMVEISGWPFASCSNLNKVEIPDTLQKISGRAFEETPWYDNLTDEFVIVGDGILLKYNGTDSKPKIPKSVKSIADIAFAENTYITKVEIPDTVTYIGDNAFSCCDKLESVKFPKNLDHLGSYIFENCTNIQEVTFPENMTTLPQGTFFSAQNLKEITLPDGITAIGDNAFTNCNTLKTVNLPNSVETIGYGAFQFCHKLTDLDIPFNVKKIGGFAFDGVPLEAYDYDNDGYVILGNGILVKYLGEDKVLEIPAGTLSIASYAISYEDNITEVICPNSLEKIQTMAFYYTDNLQKVTLNEGLEFVGERAFSDCANLEEVVLATSVNSLPTNTFYNCPNLRKITLEDFTYTKAMPLNDPSTLREVLIPEGVQELSEETLKNASNLETLWLPASLEEISYDLIVHKNLKTIKVKPNSPAVDYVKSLNLPNSFY